MANNNGLFGTSTSISIGDPFDKKSSVSDRNRGKQMVTNPSKRGNGHDALLTKTPAYLSSGDKYMDPGTLDKHDRLAQGKKKLTAEGFKYSNPSKRSAGSGNYYGCFNEKNPPKHETEYHVTKKGEIADKVAPQPRNILCSAPKKGTYGFHNTTIGKGDEFRYISDPYEGNKRKELEAAKESNKKAVGPAFKSSCKRLDYFDGHGNVAASKIYSLDKPLPARKPQAAKAAPAIAVPFKPASPAKKGYNATKYPEYKEDPYDAKQKAEREAMKKNKPPVTWKPVSGSRSMATRTIAFSNTGADL